MLRIYRLLDYFITVVFLAFLLTLPAAYAQRCATANPANMDESIVTQVFQLEHADAQAVKNYLEGLNFFGSSSLKLSIAVLERSNTLVVSGIPQEVKRMAENIAQIDISILPIIIEVQFIEASIDWAQSVVDRMHLQEVKFTSQSDIQNDIFMQVLQRQVFLLSAQQVAELKLDIKFQEDSRIQTVRSIAFTRLITSDGVKAIVEQGLEVPYQETSGNGATISHPFKKQLAFYEITPFLRDDGLIRLEILLGIEEFGNSGDLHPYPYPQRMQFSAVVDNGDAILMGGLCKLTGEDMKKLGQNRLLFEQKLLSEEELLHAEIQTLSACKLIYMVITPRVFIKK